MKKLLFIVNAGLILLPLTASAGTQAKAAPVQSPAAAAAAASVTIQIPKDSMGKGGSAYGENPKVVKPGTQVIWMNNDSVAHTVTSDSGAFDSGFIMPGKSWSHSFDQPGKFGYYCSLHGKQSMSGSIEVK